MAQQTSVTLVDDIDGSKAVESVSFALDGVGYELDLSAKNAKQLRKALAEFVAAARPLTAPSAPASRPRRRRAPVESAKPARADRAELAAIRAWASENNIPVAARGRISSEVRAGYTAAAAATDEAEAADEG